jgi:hypothetical protein
MITLKYSVNTYIYPRRKKEVAVTTMLLSTADHVFVTRRKKSLGLDVVVKKRNLCGCRDSKPGIPARK